MSAAAIIAERGVRVVDGLFNGVERNHKASVVMNKKSAPNGHAMDSVTLELCTFLKKETNVVTKWAPRKLVHVDQSLVERPYIGQFQGQVIKRCRWRVRLRGSQ